MTPELVAAIGAAIAAVILALAQLREAGHCRRHLHQLRRDVRELLASVKPPDRDPPAPPLP